jgi:hypothetical protein
MIEHKKSRPDESVVEDINRLLKDNYGVDINGLAMWRVVWSTDQYEIRTSKFTEAGVELLHPEPQEMSKYKKYVKDRWVLEHLVMIPVVNLMELPSTQISYEIIHTFWDKNGGYMVPAYAPCRFIVESVEAAMEFARTGSSARLARYAQSTEEANQAHIDEYNDIYNGLFGEESGLGGAIVHKSGVAGFYKDGKATSLNKFGSKGH